MTDLPEILTTEDVAKLFRVTTRTVQQLAANGQLPAFRVGKFWRFRREHIEAYMEGNWGTPDHGTAAPQAAEVPEAAPDAKPTPEETNARYAELIALKRPRKHGGKSRAVRSLT